MLEFRIMLTKNGKNDAQPIFYIVETETGIILTSNRSQMM